MDLVLQQYSKIMAYFPKNHYSKLYLLSSLNTDHPPGGSYLAFNYISSINVR